ncbi:MAG: crossover junction endodeoxyribonuclease RuvC [Syntrophomonas sp.]|uniref:crossover junction endodeoxyribonuclease RuvC n=1 Tax=Syntrophomonas sp. TaxID=2053627 RepID=UPI002618CD86|nr:crossover junction endodeoxyribonuclease RuvC [Syntrophomonas sp.]MDD2511340.1 crossover junction endodeoxyribonuclease RuvC [Syntrophomonas sp.]MDD3880092.1 crossover junction endodeoxyribonuclease RuvC [Syntrophomonas sp.]MDD4627668.1 crossover junction endodeoxyribonuclease RuvC [Syntrophomonas sp.]
MRVLGIDPGTATTGYGLICSEAGRVKAITYGTIVTPAQMEMPLRLQQIHKELESLLMEYKPDAVAVEEIFFNHNSKTVITVAQSRGVILMTAAAAGMPVAEYTPLQVKQAVVGYGKAEKKQVQLMVQKILTLQELPRPDDAADALAVAICHLHSYRLSYLAGSSAAKAGEKR